MATTTAIEYKNQGNQALSSGDVHTAIACYTNAIDIDPSNPVYYSNRSAAYLSIGQYEKALEDAKTAIKVQPSWGKGYARQGAAYHAMRLYEEAEASYRAGLEAEAENTNTSCRNGLEEVKKVWDEEKREANKASKANEAAKVKAKAKAETNESEEIKARGNVLYKERKFEDAIECYEKAAKKDPTNMAYLLNIAAVKFEQGGYEECRKKCEEAIQVGREQRADYALIAKAYARIGNAYVKESNNADVSLLEKAIVAYNKSLLENRTKPVEEKVKAVTQAIRRVEASAYFDPAKGLEAKEEGNVWFKAGDFPKAVKRYSEAIRRDPSNSVYYANRAAAYIKLTSFVEAKRDCETSLQLDPTYVKAYSRKGAIELFMKEYHKAVESYRKGLELDPKNEACRSGYSRVMAAIQAENQNGGPTGGEGGEGASKERAERAMSNPEIQQILRDPVMQNVLQEMQENPSSASKHLANPMVMKKMEKLMASGVLQMK